MNVLFVCTWNVQRSKTAERLFANMVPGTKRVSIRSAGTAANARLGGVQLTSTLVDWADKIFVMEQDHLHHIKKLYPEHESKVVNLDVPDVYLRNDPYLILQLREKLLPFARELR